MAIAAETQNPQSLEIPDNERSRKKYPAFRRFFQTRMALLGAIILVALFFAAVFAPILTPYGPNEISPREAYSPPSTDHLMGTDKFGRDILTRVLYGGRISLIVGLIATMIGGIGGLLLGMPAGYFGGKLDDAIMRVLDVMLAFPGILLAMVIVSILGVGLRNLMIAVGIGYVAGFARLIRSSVLSAREYDYVQAAEAIGCPNTTIMRRHILPNVTAPIIVYGTLSVASAILTAAGLSFLGLGSQPPLSEWGTMLSDGRDSLNRSWWVSFFPGAAIVVTTLSINLVGDGLRTSLDPRMRMR